MGIEPDEEGDSKLEYDKLMDGSFLPRGVRGRRASHMEVKA